MTKSRFDKIPLKMNGLDHRISVAPMMDGAYQGERQVGVQTLTGSAMAMSPFCQPRHLSPAASARAAL
jgi:hypothetical protein